MSSSHGTIQTVENVLEYFREELLTAFEDLDLEASHETEAYLVHLLEGFTRLSPESSQEVGFDKPAAFLLGEAMNTPGGQRIEKYRRLGDASLFNCGFFEGYISRRLVDAEYYQDVGRSSYARLTDLVSNRAPSSVFASVYEELTRNFDGMVEAFKHLGRSLSSDGMKVSRETVEIWDQQAWNQGNQTNDDGQFQALKGAGFSLSDPDETN